MKSTNLILASFLVVALLFSSASVEAKSNFSNKLDKSEEKVKASTFSDFMPVVGLEDAPVFSSYQSTGFLAKYSPEQLNKLIGVWPDRIESQPDTKVVGEQKESTWKYTPEQFVQLLGMVF